MIFKPLDLDGAFRIELEFKADERGAFARSWCQREFAARGLTAQIAQCNISINRARGTVRGMHFQADPHAEAKVVRCVRGKIHDIIVDLRPGSPTYCRWTAVELEARAGAALYVPEGFAHGFQTLEDDTEVHYLMSEFYAPESARGVRWDDPAFGIRWPLEISSISVTDRSYPAFAP